MKYIIYLLLALCYNLSLHAQIVYTPFTTGQSQATTNQSSQTMTVTAYCNNTLSNVISKTYLKITISGNSAVVSSYYQDGGFGSGQWFNLGYGGNIQKCSSMSGNSNLQMV